MSMDVGKSKVLRVGCVRRLGWGCRGGRQMDWDGGAALPPAYQGSEGGEHCGPA
jgi:hypothetical protein